MAHVLIAEARFYEDLNDQLLDGVRAAIEGRIFIFRPTVVRAAIPGRWTVSAFETARWHSPLATRETANLEA